MSEFTQLIVMKRTYKKPKEGDVFALQPLKDIFYFGKVIQTELESVDSFIRGMSLVYIYDCSSKEKAVPDEFDENELLIAPVIVNHQPWTKGYFETIGNVDVSAKVKSVDFAFWDMLREKYVDLSRAELKLHHDPKYRSIFGLGSYGIVGKDVQKALKSKEVR